MLDSVSPADFVSCQINYPRRFKTLFGGYRETLFRADKSFDSVYPAEPREKVHEMTSLLEIREDYLTPALRKLHGEIVSNENDLLVVQDVLCEATRVIQCEATITAQKLLFCDLADERSASLLHFWCCRDLPESAEPDRVKHIRQLDQLRDRLRLLTPVYRDELAKLIQRHGVTELGEIIREVAQRYEII